MSYKLVLATPASAVATNGTFTASYPTGTTAGSFSSYRHKIFVRGMQTLFTQDAGQISVSFGASSITVTYKGTTTIPAGSIIDCQFDVAGDATAPISLVVGSGALAGPSRAVYTPYTRLDLGTPATAASNNVCLSQSVTAGTAALLNGALLAAGRILFDIPRNFVAAWTTSSVCTVRGKDEYGNLMTESSASATSMVGKKAFKEILSVNFSISVTSMTGGTGVVLGLPVFVEKATQIMEELKNMVILPRKAGIVSLPWILNSVDLPGNVAQNLISPVAGVIKTNRGICQAAVTTGGTITLKIGTTVVVGATFTVANADPAGTIYAGTPPTLGDATAVVAVASRLQIVPAAFATAGVVNGVIDLAVSELGKLDGTLVVGDQTVPTATTGDVRGTWSPFTAPNGTDAYSLIVEAPDPAYLGVANFTS